MIIVFLDLVVLIVNSFMHSGFDKETGEVRKDTWDAEAEVEGIRKALNYCQCFISRMPMEDSGPFWDATIYSPRNPKMGPRLALSPKSGLDPKKYGGFSSQKFAYFFVYEAIDKKGRHVFRFAEVPVWLASRVEGSKGALEKYASELAESENLQFVGIERAKILKKQLIEIDGERFIVAGLKGIRNGGQLAFSQSLLSEINAIKDEDAPASVKIVAAERVFQSIIENQFVIGGRLGTQLRLEGLAPEFYSSAVSDKVDAILSLLSLYSGAANMADLSMIGGSKNSGYMRVTHSKLLSDKKSSYFVIDQSVTGMFEKRTRIGL
ncbi:MAG: Cas9 endonuclease PAM-interacting domain-containing protein [Coriobacteriia bacterium]|nr:Cas9 endonuclease PAM-interacting domain-containing protein [Coriobacteriia bacterium]